MSRGTLSVVAYHYVRDLDRTKYPRIKGLRLDRFRAQVDELCDRYKMATLEEALHLVAGRSPSEADLCLLTFDDGLKEHYTEVLPILRERGIQGLFFPATAGFEGRVATVHKIHFLMAAVDVAEYGPALLGRVAEISPGTPREIGREAVAGAYPWDEPEIGTLKYIANFLLPPVVRDAIFDDLFAHYLGDEATFARELYLTWDEARELQAEGMVIGGHSHAHTALAGMPRADQRNDLKRCAELLRSRLSPQTVWPFAYPYGRYDAATVDLVVELGFGCAFTVEPGIVRRGDDRCRLRRFDTNHFPIAATARAGA